MLGYDCDNCFRNKVMHPQTHFRSGRHVHHHVLDWRSLRGQFDLMTDQDYKEEPCEAVTSSPGHGGQDGGQSRDLHTRQLDYLSSQLGSLKQNMVEKQSCLAHVRMRVITAHTACCDNMWR